MDSTGVVVHDVELIRCCTGRNLIQEEKRNHENNERDENRVSFFTVTGWNNWPGQSSVVF